MTKYVAVSNPQDLIAAINHVNHGLTSVVKQANSVISAQRRINRNHKHCIMLLAVEVALLSTSYDCTLRKMQEEIRLLRKEVEELKSKGE